jgi:hypothetical protein
MADRDILVQGKLNRGELSNTAAPRKVLVPNRNGFVGSLVAARRNNGSAQTQTHGCFRQSGHLIDEVFVIIIGSRAAGSINVLICRIVRFSVG